MPEATLVDYDTRISDTPLITARDKFTINSFKFMNMWNPTLAKIRLQNVGV